MGRWRCGKLRVLNELVCLIRSREPLAFSSIRRRIACNAELNWPFVPFASNYAQKEPDGIYENTLKTSDRLLATRFQMPHIRGHNPPFRNPSSSCVEPRRMPPCFHGWCSFYASIVRDATTCCIYASLTSAPDGEPEHLQLCSCLGARVVNLDSSIVVVLYNRSCCGDLANAIPAPADCNSPVFLQNVIPDICMPSFSLQPPQQAQPS